MNQNKQKRVELLIIKIIVIIKHNLMNVYKDKDVPIKI